MENNIENKKLSAISEKIKKNINMDLLQIKEVFDEESKKFTTNVATSEAYLKGLETGKQKICIDIGLKLINLFGEIEKETGMTFEEFRLLNEYKREYRD